MSSKEERAAALLRRRAGALAKKPAPRDEREQLEVLRFTLEGGAYAVERRHVMEAKLVGEITPIPCAPPHILGVTSVRGRVVALMDLGRILDLAPARATSGAPARADDLAQAVVLAAAGMEAAVRVDEVRGVDRIPLHEITATPPGVGEGRARYLRGVLPDGAALVAVERLLTDPVLVVEQKVG